MAKNASLRDYASEISDTRNFTLLKFEGSGSFKETYKIVHKSNVYALKIFFPSKFDLRRTEREIESMMKCQHKNIGKIYEFDSISIKGTEIHYTVEDFLDDGTLTDRIRAGSLKKNDIINIGAILVDCLEHLELLDLVHRDIKPDNIMFHKNEKHSPVLVDFGLVRVLNEQSLTPSFLNAGPGTPIFSAPEQLNNDKTLIDWKTDQFSLGIVLSYCFLNKHPFKKNGEQNHRIIDRISKREEPVKEFIDQCISNDLEYLVRMVKAWPHHRFQDIKQLKEVFNN